ncbi:MAG TPA: FAD-dependent oxidoreductase [Candidatus Acidoferrales bacterium]|nr:FAD-dependent oxidoreductase [Candidatus Acidoferrales bacterium]
MELRDVDLIVIGSGQGGVPLAADAARSGKRVVLFERERYGGSCINFGCTPSKALLAAAHNAGRARRAARIGIHCDVRVDQPAVFERVRAIRERWSAGTRRRLVDAGVELVHASAAFVGERTVQGGQVVVRAPRVVIDTGTSPAAPPIPGLAQTPFLTNKTFFDLKALPTRLLIVGGGYIGLELGQGARRLGCEVTILQRGPRLLPEEEADASAAIATGLAEDGVTVRLNANTSGVTYAGGSFTVTLDGEEPVSGEALLIATGRTPNVVDLDLEKSGITRTRGGFIEVDEYLETRCPGVYAIGDVSGQPAFTHVSWEDYRRLASTFAGSPRRRDDRVLSYTTFTEPQLARCGLTEAQARAKGIDARSVTMPLSQVARAVEWDLELGFFRLVIDNATDKLIGATFVGYEMGELIHIITAHVEAGATWQLLDRSMYVHPTLAEGLPGLARQFSGG